MEINKDRGTYAVDGLSSYTTDLRWPIAKIPLSSSSLTPALPKVCRLLVRLQKGQIYLPGEPVTLPSSRSCGSNPGWAEAGASLNLRAEVKPMEHLWCWWSSPHWLTGSKSKGLWGETIPWVCNLCPLVPVGMTLTQSLQSLGGYKVLSLLFKIQPGSLKSTHPAERQTQMSGVFSKLQQLQRSLSLSKFLYVERRETPARSRAPGCSSGRQGTDGEHVAGDELAWKPAQGKLCSSSKTGRFNEWNQNGALRKRTSRAGRGLSGIAFAPVPSHPSTHPSVAAGSTLPSALPLCCGMASARRYMSKVVGFFYLLFFLKNFWILTWILKLLLQSWATPHMNISTNQPGWGGSRWEPLVPRCSAFTFIHPSQT